MKNKMSKEQKKIKKLKERVVELTNDLESAHEDIKYWKEECEMIKNSLTSEIKGMREAFSKAEGNLIPIYEERDWLRSLVMGITIPVGREEAIAREAERIRSKSGLHFELKDNFSK